MISLVLQNLEWASPSRECGVSKGIQESVSRQRPKTSRISAIAKTVLEWWTSFTFIHPWYIFSIDAVQWLVIVYVRNIRSPKTKSDGLPSQLENWTPSVPVTSNFKKRRHVQSRAPKPHCGSASHETNSRIMRHAIVFSRMKRVKPTVSACILYDAFRRF